MRLYVSGPMRGIPEYNFPAFDRATSHLRVLGFDVVSPAEHDRQVDPLYATRPGYATGAYEDGDGGAVTFHQLIGWDLEQLARPGNIDGVVLLQGWENSTGAKHELYVADVTGKTVWFYNDDGVLQMRDPRVRSGLLIGLTGYAQSGKDTIGAWLTEYMGFERASFADTLRTVLYALDPLVEGDRHIYEGLWSVRDLVDSLGWEAAKATGSTEYNVRHYLQRLGTEAGREVLGDRIWVDTAMRKLTGSTASHVFTDVRFPNEYEAIKAQGGAIWRVDRPGCTAVNAHASETALDGYPVDVVVTNDGTIPDLHKVLARVFAASLLTVG